MIGVTICSPKFRHLAQLAQQHFEEATGLPSVLFSTPVEKNYLAKFELHTMFKGQTVVYFDADLWFLRKVDLSHFDQREEFLAVLDPGVYNPLHFPSPDCKTLGIESNQYFNSGLFIWNDRHKPIFAEALNIYRKEFRRLGDFGEQSVLNAAVQRLGKVGLISNTFNYTPHGEKDKDACMEPQENPATAHAAGIPLPDKLQALQYYKAKFSRKFD